MTTKFGYILTGIVILAAILRFYALGHVPASMNADEAAIGYNAYSILKTGKDEYGRRMPLLFQSFDDYKLPLYEYITVPSVAVFGLTDTAVRLPSAVLGTLTVLATFYLVYAAISSIPIALLSSFLLAISPWHLQFSRSAYEANIAVFFVVIGVTWLLHAVKKPILYIPSFLALALSVWAYHSSRVFVPLLGVGYIILFRQAVIKNKIHFAAGLIMCTVLCLPLLLLSLSSSGLVRARGVSALDDPALTARNVSWRITDLAKGLPLSNLYHNQRLVDASIILKGYLDHYDPNFFVSEIVQGKYHAPGVGLMYVWELPLLLYGLHKLAGFKGKEKFLLFLWFLLAPLAAAPTEMLPHPVRTLIFLPVLQIFVAVGLWEAYLAVSKKSVIGRSVIIGAGALIIVLNFAYYLHQYYVHGPVDYASDWQYGHEQVVREVAKIQDKYAHVVVSTSLDEPYMFFLYYLKYDPALYLSEGGTKSGKFDEERNAFGKYEFHRFMKTTGVAQAHTLYVGQPQEIVQGASRLYTVKYPDGSDAYVISASD